jgi:hypothetical protein
MVGFVVSSQQQCDELIGRWAVTHNMYIQTSIDKRECGAQKERDKLVNFHGVAIYYEISEFDSCMMFVGRYYFMELRELLTFSL